jgi:hypothetical protein
MKTLTRFQLTFAVAALCSLAPALPSRAQDVPRDYQQVLTYLGKKGDYKANVLKINIPRDDIKVTIDGIATPTPFGFGGWVAMTKGDRGADVMMGDLVLQQDEVNPVMSALLDSGLEVTALHNHFFWEEPRIFYMHVHGNGSGMELAREVKPALDLIDAYKTGKVRTTKTTTAQADTSATAAPLDTAKLSQIVGYLGEQSGLVYKITIGRDDLQLKEMGATINARMGLNTWAAFAGSEENAQIAGDVAMLESEVTPVLKALRAHGLNIVAIHQHMTGTTPMIIFLHYWGRGPAAQLATGFRSALNELGKHPNQMMHH